MNDLFVFTSFTTSNCYIVTPSLSDGISYVIDLPPDLDPVLDYIKKENLSIGGALLTHGHFDHALGMSSFDGSIYIDLNDEQLARNPEEQLKSFMGLNLDSITYQGELNEVKDIKSDELIVHSNPGHTKGSSSFEFPSLGIVFTGDFIFKDGIGRTDLLTGDTNEMIHSINNVFTGFHDDYILYPGHGDKDTVKSIKNNNILVREYLND